MKRHEQEVTLSQLFAGRHISSPKSGSRVILYEIRYRQIYSNKYPPIVDYLNYSFIFWCGSSLSKRNPCLVWILLLYDNLRQISDGDHEIDHRTSRREDTEKLGEVR